ncbi:MAG TPA: SprT family zinc-dependent metalloprotease [Opitutaceae bacterium]|nr:SprT family zinc-dependent metalloprotease [Opitutaceae bacterium]
MPTTEQQWFDFETSAPAATELAPAPLLVAPSAPAPQPEAVNLPGEPAIVVRRSPKAQRYRLSVGRDGLAVLTIPTRGSERQARQFLETQRDWLERTRHRLAQLPRSATVWTIGTSVLWRGEWRAIERASDATPHISLGGECFRVSRHEGDLRATLEAHFRRIARIELPPRTWELAAVTGVEVREVSVRDQRTRWGSCSSTGTISLNWRLVQAPSFAADYIILHELMHVREMNHSERFWALVEGVCPRWQEAERWLKNHGGALGL